MKCKPKSSQAEETALGYTFGRQRGVRYPDRLKSLTKLKKKKCGETTGL